MAKVGGKGAAAIQARKDNRNVNYVLMKAIKEHNLRGEHVGFRRLCEVSGVDPHKVTLFIRNAEAWGMVKVKLGAGDVPLWPSRPLVVSAVGEAFLRSCQEEEAGGL